MLVQTERQRALTAASATPPHSAYFYLNEAGAADYLSTTKRRLKDLRGRGGGPRFVRLGQSVRYRSDWLDDWAEKNAVSSTSEETARFRR